MVTIIIEMNALPKKLLELKQSLLALAEPTRKEKGCLSFNVFQNIEDNNGIGLNQMWQNREVLDDYLRSRNFTLLKGTKHLLSRDPEIKISEVFDLSGRETL